MKAYENLKLIGQLEISKILMRSRTGFLFNPFTTDGIHICTNMFARCTSIFVIIVINIISKICGCSSKLSGRFLLKMYRKDYYLEIVLGKIEEGGGQLFEGNPVPISVCLCGGLGGVFWEWKGPKSKINK